MRSRLLLLIGLLITCLLPLGRAPVAAQGDDVANIKKHTETLQNAFHALSQQLYSQGQPQPETPGGPSPRENGGDDVIEGEVKE